MLSGANWPYSFCLLLPLTGVSAAVSFCSLTWAVGTYTKAMHKINPDHRESSWIAMTLQVLWRGGMLISRITVLVLTAVYIRKWFLLFVGLHWVFMTGWVILQKTDFCPTVWEERIYNCIIGLIYCFDYFNLRVGKSRYRALLFYSIVIMQNLVSLIVYAFYFKDSTQTEPLVIIASVIFGGMVVGMTSMCFYYGKFHPSRAARISKATGKNSEIVIKQAANPRSLIQYYASSFRSLPRSMENSERAASEEATTDKQFLLTNVVQISESTEDGIVNQSCNVECDSKAVCRVISTCESSQSNAMCEEKNSTLQIPSSVLSCNTWALSVIEFEKQNGGADEKYIHRQKRRGICLPTAQDLDIDKAGVSVVVQDSQKRRGICSSDQLVLEIENPTVEEIPQKDDSAEKSEFSILGITSINDKVADNLEVIKIRERLETPRHFEEEKTEKLLKERDESMSCVTSIHDYENVCPLGVARPPWCIRSWKGYMDIETYIHDDSVVRDRRRDTLTSTTTGTTYSSEFSDTTCGSSILRGILKQDDYLDTLTYDLIDQQELRSIYAESASMKSSLNQGEQNAAPATLHIAKPVVIDEKGGMFALDTILEERDEFESSVDEELEYKIRSTTSESVSTLVSTIDQISKYTAENSPRHVYHTTGTHWEDLDPKNFLRKAQLTRVLLNNELRDSCEKIKNNYINRLDDADTIVRGKCEIDTIKELVKYCTIESIKKTPLIDAILSDSPVLGNKAKLQKQVTISYRNDDSPSGDNDLYVEMSPLPRETVDVVVHNASNLFDHANSSEKFDNINLRSTSPQVASSQNVDTVESGFADPENTLDKRKRTPNYSRRNFSLLRERFEPKSQFVYVVTPNSALKVDESNLAANSAAAKKCVSVVLKKSYETFETHDKENLAPVLAVAKGSDTVYENDKPMRNSDFNLQERRHIFLEQVLSPPKLLNLTNTKSLGARCSDT